MTTAASGPKTLLAYPPITDPTSPYHSLVYLASFARARGFDAIQIRDTNVEALNYLAQPAVLRELLDGWRRREAAFSQKTSLSGSEQVEYRQLLRSRLLGPESARDAIGTLRDPDRFYDYAAYHDAVRTILTWLGSLSLDAFPGQFDHGFDLNATPANLSSVDELSDPEVLERIVGPFKRYFDDVFLPFVRKERFEAVGLNVTYTSQLPYALWLARQIRRELPQAYVVCGGTEISDVWKYAVRRDRLGELFAGVDACIVGEGETAFAEMLGALRDGRRPAGVTNAVHFEAGVATAPARITYEDLEALPTPDYTLMADAGYFSPERFVYYSPTRGCYWNRCTFCDYGLNFGTPTSPWRQRKPQTVLDDLREISKHARFVYLSVDVLAPGFLSKLARAVAEAGIEIRWAAEMRLEKAFTAETCADLRRSGCVAVSVGFESGCQRILDLIDKGTKPAQIAATLGDFRQNGIAVQMMGFTDFPGETEAEALESITFLAEHRDRWTVGGLGEFTLTPGAIVAMRPEDFGLLEHGPHEGHDIARLLRYRERSPKSDDERENVARAKRQLRRQHFDRPFAGGIDTPHSMFYYDRFGCAFPDALVSSLERARGAISGSVPLALNGAFAGGVAFEAWACVDASILEATRTRIGREEGRQLSARDFLGRLDAEHPAQPRSAHPMTYFIRSDGTSAPLTREVYRVLQHVAAGRTLDEAVALEANAPGTDRSELALAPALISALGLVVAAGRPAAIPAAS
jgi:radical SAM superfamily enzyme YgiQ (UPF0313 family)